MSLLTRVAMGGVGAIATACFAGALYYWVSGMFLGGTVSDIYSALVWFIVGLVLAGALAGGSKVAETLTA